LQKSPWEIDGSEGGRDPRWLFEGDSYSWLADWLKLKKHTEREDSFGFAENWGDRGIAPTDVAILDGSRLELRTDAVWTEMSPKPVDRHELTSHSNLREAGEIAQVTWIWVHLRNWICEITNFTNYRSGTVICSGENKTLNTEFMLVPRRPMWATVDIKALVLTFPKRQRYPIINRPFAVDEAAHT
jgi:hypothetical protein